MTMSPKRQRFVEEYLIDLNATAAAVRAGYSSRSGKHIGSELLQDAEIAAAIKAAQDERSRRTEVTADRVLQELAKIGFGDIRKIFSPGGSLLTPSDMDDDTAATIASVEVVTRRAPGADGDCEVEYVHKIKAWDKLGALTQMGRHLGMFKDRVEHAGPDGGPMITKIELVGPTE